GRAGDPALRLHAGAPAQAVRARPRDQLRRSGAAVSSVARSGLEKVIRLVLGRIAGGIGVVIAVATLAFFLLHAAPGGPFDAERSLPANVKRNVEAHYHLDEPVVVQYGRYMNDLAHGYFGQSFKRVSTVGEIIRDHFPYSLVIGLAAL